MVVFLILDIPVEHTLGGDSFVQFVIGANVGLMAIKTFRDWVNHSWRDVQEFLSVADSNLLDKLNNSGHAAPKELQERASNRIKADCEITLKKWQRRFWLICSTLAGLSFVAGLTCLYFDRYCPWNALLLIPWPLFWVASRSFCFFVKRKAANKFQTLGDCLGNPANVAQVVKAAMGK